MLPDTEALEQFIASHYPNVSDKILNENHIAGHCPICDREMGLQVISVMTALHNSRNFGPVDDFTHPYTTVLRCPVCHGFMMWVLYKIRTLPSAQIFRIAAIPAEGKYEIPELPVNPKLSDKPTLKQFIH